MLVASELEEVISLVDAAKEDVVDVCGAAVVFVGSGVLAESLIVRLLPLSIEALDEARLEALTEGVTKGLEVSLLNSTVGPGYIGRLEAALGRVEDKSNVELLVELKPAGTVEL